MSAIHIHHHAAKTTARHDAIDALTDATGWVFATVGVWRGRRREPDYLAPVSERPRYYSYEIGADEKPYMPLEPHRVKIHDMRPVAGELSLDREGFELVEQHTAVRDFWDDDEVRRIYYPEAEAFIKQA